MRTTPTSAWQEQRDAPAGVAIAERSALGTIARVVVAPPEQIHVALALANEELARLDAQASRFRADAEIARVSAAGAGTYLVSPGCAEAMSTALRAARWTDGRVDPTVGDCLVALGYDRDFALLPDDDTALVTSAARPAAGWQHLSVNGRLLSCARRIGIDLGATAKGLGADRIARRIGARGERAVLVSLGGDLAVGGRLPAGGWPLRVADTSLHADGGQVVRMLAGGLATSATHVREWRRGGARIGHIVDPRTGAPARISWRAASVAAHSCAEANAAATAALVDAGGVAWLAATGLPARLVAEDGTVTRLGPWPAEDDALLAAPPASGWATLGPPPDGGQ